MNSDYTHSIALLPKHTTGDAFEAMCYAAAGVSQSGAAPHNQTKNLQCVASNQVAPKVHKGSKIRHRVALKSLPVFGVDKVSILYHVHYQDENFAQTSIS